MCFHGREEIANHAFSTTAHALVVVGLDVMEPMSEGQTDEGGLQVKEATAALVAIAVEDPSPWMW